MVNADAFSSTAWPLPMDAASSPSTLRQAPVVIWAIVSSETTPASRTICRSTAELPSLSWMKWTFLLSRRVCVKRSRARYICRGAGGPDIGSCRQVEVRFHFYQHGDTRGTRHLVAERPADQPGHRAEGHGRAAHFTDRRVRRPRGTTRVRRVRARRAP